MAIMKMRRLLALALLAACGGGGGGSGPNLPPGPDGYPEDRVGVINLFEGSGAYASIQNGPELQLPRKIAQDGDCMVWVRPKPALCEPGCTDGVCTAPNVCTPWPALAGAGPITVTGLYAPLTFQPSQFGYEPEPEPLDRENLFADDAHITISAPGADTAGFSVELDGVPPLQVSTQNLQLVDGVDHQVTWSSRQTGKIQLQLLVGWHGSPWEAMLLCETDDHGSLTISGALAAELPRQSNGLEQHLSTIRRFRRAVVMAPAGPIEVIIGSQQSINFNRR